MQKHLEKLKSKPLSWSALSSWNFDKTRASWARKYLDGIYEPENELMKFGKEVGERLASDPQYLPAVLRYPVFEKKLLAEIKRKKKDSIQLVGLMDSFDPETCNFYEYKTSSNKNKWNDDSANLHGQMLFYCYLIYVNYKVPPEKIKMNLFYIPVSTDGDFKMVVDEKGIQSFEVTHTLFEVAKFGAFIIKTFEEMEKFALEYASTEPLN